MRMALCFFFFLSLLPLTAETVPQTPGKRSFDEIFPKIPDSVREAAFSGDGFLKSTKKVPQSELAGFGQNALDPVIEAVYVKQPSFLVEAILVIPNTGEKYSLLDVYNALGKVRGLKGRVYRSHTRKEEVPLFEEVTRLESAKKNTPVADPAPAVKIPPSETVYMRLKDANFGNSFYRGDMTLVQRGLCYSLTNNKALTYVIPVIKEEKFTVQFYFEPIKEGILIYSIAGADVSDFVASKIDMASAIRKRLAVIIGWVVEGIGSGKH